MQNATIMQTKWRIMSAQTQFPCMNISNINTTKNNKMYCTQSYFVL